MLRNHYHYNHMLKKMAVCATSHLLFVVCGMYTKCTRRTWIRNSSDTLTYTSPHVRKYTGNWIIYWYATNMIEWKKMRPGDRAAPPHNISTRHRDTSISPALCEWIWVCACADYVDVVFIECYLFVFVAFSSMFKTRRLPRRIAFVVCVRAWIHIT